MQALKPITIILLLLLPVVVKAGSDAPDGFKPRLSGEIVNLTLQSRGSQFHNPEWLYGDIELYSGETVKNKQLRYNGFRDALIWLHADTQQSILLDTDLIKGFILHNPAQNRTMTFERLIPRAGSEGMFAERLYSGMISLYAHRKIEQTGEATQLQGNALRPIAVLEPKPAYYIIDHNQQVIELNRLNRRSLLAAFPEHRREIRALLRQNRIGVFNEAELVQAAFHIDQYLQDGQ